MQISALQQDALAEVFNIGVGRAASSLSQILCSEVSLHAPSVQFMPPEAVTDWLFAAGDRQLSTVMQTFSGPFEARAMMVFPERNALVIVSHMFRDDISPEELSEYEQEALCEFGNIILNACISAFADLLGLEFHGSLPEHFLAQQGCNFFSDAAEPSVLVLHVDIAISQEKIEGNLCFLLGFSSLQYFLQGIDRYLQHQGLV